MIQTREISCINTKSLEFDFIISDLVSNITVQKMNQFMQHYNTSCFEHCRNVAYYSYIICKKYNLDYISAARAGMLHDLFLYDWRKKQDTRKRFHGFRHPRIALNNATELFELNEKEQDIILKHMWPITIVLPKYKESYIITLVDKYCAIKESIEAYKSKRKLQVAYRYAYVFLSMLVILK